MMLFLYYLDDAIIILAYLIAHFILSSLYVTPIHLYNTMKFNYYFNIIDTLNLYFPNAYFSFILTRS